MRGFFCIGLHQPKTPVNVGSSLRAAGCYGASNVFYSGKRFKKGKSLTTDPQKYYRELPLIRVDNLYDVIPYDCIPVGVEFTNEAIPLTDYIHPKRAFYIFGPEDGSLGDKIKDWCKHVLYISTNNCMNLAATVNVVLYDRMLKNRMVKN